MTRSPPIGPLLALFSSLAGCFESPHQDSGPPRPDDSGGDADSDADADSDTDTDSDTNLFTEAAIDAIQGGDIPAGAWVAVQGVVVGGLLDEGFHLGTEGTATAASGVWVAWDDHADDALVEGALVRVRGEVREVAGVDGAPGDGSLTTVAVTSRGGVEVTGFGAAPQPAVLTVDALLDPMSVEPWEGVLVALDEVEVSAGGDGRWEVGGGLPVGALYFPSTALTGASLERLVGVLWFDGRSFLLEPRSEADLVGYDARLDDCGEARCVAAVQPGDLVIDEVMRDPEAVLDDHGEWFELYNAADAAVDLRGLQVRDEGWEGFTVVDSVLVGAGDFVVLGPDPDPSGNGGLEIAYGYDFGTFSLGQGADALVLAHGGVELEAVSWDDGVTFPALAGAAMALDPAHLDAGSNDDGSSWCSAVSAYGAGDLGTPGAMNDACGE
ncbi:MAG: lamin tail domain-containing protein [Pseudomonadota bacterium]